MHEWFKSYSSHWEQFAIASGHNYFGNLIPLPPVISNGPPLTVYVHFTPGGRFSKDPVTYPARKAILETMIRLP